MLPPNIRKSYQIIIQLLPQLKKESLISLNLLLKLKQTKQESLRGRWTPRHININWNNSITSSNYRIRIMIISTTIRTRSHAHDPPGLRHLIINLSQGGSHLIRQSPCNNHDIGLTGRGTEYHTETLHIVSGCCGVHHFYGTTCEAECHGPERTFTRPVDEIVNFWYSVFYFVGGGDSLTANELVYSIEAWDLLQNSMSNIEKDGNQLKESSCCPLWNWTRHFQMWWITLTDEVVEEADPAMLRRIMDIDMDWTLPDERMADESIVKKIEIGAGRVGNSVVLRWWLQY